MADTAAPSTVGAFDRDTAVRLEDSSESERIFAADVSPDWRAGRGPHGGYLAAMILRALSEAVADPTRAPRSLTIHYARAPEPGPVTIRCTFERVGRSLSTLSARMEQSEGTLVALALAAFSVPWHAQEVSELQMPDVAPPEAARREGRKLHPALPPFTRHIVIQPRLGAAPSEQPAKRMEVGAWLGLLHPRPIDALSLAFYSDALFPPAMLSTTEPMVAPTVDLTIHFRATTPRVRDPDPEELCFARFRCGLVHEGFFEEDGVIWAANGTVLAQSRQLGLLIPVKTG